MATSRGEIQGSISEDTRKAKCSEKFASSSKANNTGKRSDSKTSTSSHSSFLSNSSRNNSVQETLQPLIYADKIPLPDSNKEIEDRSMSFRMCEFFKMKTGNENGVKTKILSSKEHYPRFSCNTFDGNNLKIKENVVYISNIFLFVLNWV